MHFGPTVRADISFRGDVAKDMAGYSVSSAGDVDGDGLDDVLIGAFTSSPQAREMAGTVYCVLGGSKKKGTFDLSDLNGFDGFTMYGEHSGDGAGFDVAAAADFNNDGIDDIIVSSVFQKGSASNKGGNAYVIFGQHFNSKAPTTMPTGPSAMPTPAPSRPTYSLGNEKLPFPSKVALSSIQGMSAGSILRGEETLPSIAFIGDVDFDGIDDFVAAADGKAYLIYGAANDDIFAGDLNSITTQTSGNFVGAAIEAPCSIQVVASAGDFNLDGHDDMALACPADNDSTGTVFVVFGGDGFPETNIISLESDMMLGVDYIQLQGGSNGDGFGSSLSSLDFNNDGYADVVIGAPQSSCAYVYYGHGRCLLLAAQRDLADLLRHAKFHDHTLCCGGDALEIVRRASRDLVVTEDDLLGNATAQRNSHHGLQVLARVETGVSAVLVGREKCQATGAAAGGDGDLGDLIIVRNQGTHDRVSSLVVRNKLALLERGFGILLLRAKGDTVEGVRDLLGANLGKVFPCRENGGLVQQVCEHSARETGGATRNGLEVDVVGERLVARVHAEDGNAALEVGVVDHDASIEAARPQERRVEDVSAVGRGDHDDSGVALEAIHLGEDLVESLLALVVAAALSTATLAAHSIDLVDEDDARSVLLGLSEEIAHARSANSNKHLHELGAGHREEGHSGLARNSTSEERLASAGRALENQAARDAGAQLGETLRLLEELHNLFELDLSTVNTDHVLERDAGVGDHLYLGLGLTHLHRVARAARHAAARHAPVLSAVRQEEEAAEEEEREGQRLQDAAATALRGVLLREHSHVHLVLAQGVEQRRVVGQCVKLVAIAVGIDNKHALAVGGKGRLLHVVLLHRRDELAVAPVGHAA